MLPDATKVEPVLTFGAMNARGPNRHGGTTIMYFKLNRDVFFRSYDEVGYITSTGLFTDRVVDASGAMFLGALTREPKSIDQLSEEIASCFIDVNPPDIEQDIVDFFQSFVDDGFVVCGQTAEETETKTTGFTYDTLNPKTIKQDFTPEKTRADASTQDSLEDFFLEKPKLVNFQIELTSRCNERCLHCYIPHELKDGNIDPELYYSVLDQLEELGTWHITLSGGEPMLHPQFKEFLQAAKDKDFYVTVLSNLTLLDDEIISIMAEGNKCSVQVSLYSMDAQRHDEITQLPGSFEKTLSAIKRLIENDIPIQVSCPTMKENMHDFGDVLRWAHDHKIRAVTDYSIMAEYNHDTSNLAHRLTPEECGIVIRDVIDWDKNYQEQLLSTDFEKKAHEYSENTDAILCGVGISTCCMVSDGNVYPCAGWQDCICGNLNEESLSYIWNNSEKMNYLRSLRRKDMQKCIGCDKQAFCAPCMVRNANESPTGDPFEISPYFCEVAGVNKDIVLKWREDHLAMEAK